jgi:hypothetical protein
MRDVLETAPRRRARTWFPFVLSFVLTVITVAGILAVLGLLAGREIP